MEFANEFELPASPADVWPRLIKIEEMATCMPGAEVGAADGDGKYELKLRVALGPMRLTYGGELTVVETDDTAHTMSLAAKVKEARGGGRAEATVKTALTAAGEGTKVAVTTDLQISGRAAQMGRSVIDDVAKKMTADFATCLQGRMAAPESSGSGGATPPPSLPQAQRPVGGLRLMLSVLRSRIARLFGRSH
jgi:uncharacterized protein